MTMLSIEYLKKQLLDASSLLQKTIEKQEDINLKDELTEVENKLLVAIGICNSAQMQGNLDDD